jgi:hypothetical protein
MDDKKEQKEISVERPNGAPFGFVTKEGHVSKEHTGGPKEVQNNPNPARLLAAMKVGKIVGHGFRMETQKASGLRSAVKAGAKKAGEAPQHQGVQGRGEEADKHDSASESAH